MSEDSITILHASELQHTCAFQPEVSSMIIDEIKKFSSLPVPIKLIIRPHPSDELKPFEEMLKNRNDTENVVLDNKEKLYDQLERAYFVIAHWTTVSQEAMFCGKPVIDFAIKPSSPSTAYTKSGATFIARSLEDLHELFCMFLTPQNITGLELIYNKQVRAREWLIDELGY